MSRKCLVCKQETQYHLTDYKDYLSYGKKIDAAWSHLDGTPTCLELMERLGKSRFIL